MPRRRNRPRSATEIREILDTLASSGLSRRQFAADHDIPLSTLQSWLAKDGKRSSSQAADLIAVDLGEAMAPPPCLEIELVSGEILRVPPGCRADDLRLALTELRRC